MMYLVSCPNIHDMKTTKDHHPSRPYRSPTRKQTLLIVLTGPPPCIPNVHVYLNNCKYPSATILYTEALNMWIIATPLCVERLSQGLARPLENTDAYIMIYKLAKFVMK